MGSETWYQEVNLELVKYVLGALRIRSIHLGWGAADIRLECAFDKKEYNVMMRARSLDPAPFERWASVLGVDIGRVVDEAKEMLRSFGPSVYEPEGYAWLGSRIEGELEARGLSKTDLAVALASSKGSITALIKGEKSDPLLFVAALLYLGLDPASFLDACYKEYREAPDSRSAVALSTPAGGAISIGFSAFVCVESALLLWDRAGACTACIRRSNVGLDTQRIEALDLPFSASELSRHITAKHARPAGTVELRALWEGGAEFVASLDATALSITSRWKIRSGAPDAQGA
ncbi:MAG: hypothetical protein AAGI01_02665 [Myxococcota bacterium]